MKDSKISLFEDEDNMPYEELKVIEEPDDYQKTLERLSTYANENLTYVLVKTTEGLVAKEIGSLTPSEFTDWAISILPTLEISRNNLLLTKTKAQRQIIFEDIIIYYKSLQTIWKKYSGSLKS